MTPSTLQIQTIRHSSSAFSSSSEALISSHVSFQHLNTIPTFDWTVIGGGPGGIAAVGQLLSHGVPPQSLLWLDSHFEAGDFGRKWRRVSSNTTVALFIKFYRACAAFQYTGIDPNTGKPFEIENEEPSGTCTLELAAQPLRVITRTLRQNVSSLQCQVDRLSESKGAWLLHGKEIAENSQETILAKSFNVVLAVGAEPVSLHGKIKGAADLCEIPVSIALDPLKLEQTLNAKTHTVALFGSSHTAIILMRWLLERGIRVHNFFREPLRYALYLPDMILYDDSGLKGDTARWARENLHDELCLPEGLTRTLVDDDARVQSHLKDCTHVIYATGFARRSLSIDGLPTAFPYNPHCGIIAPGLFGCGLAFPQRFVDKYQNESMRVGLWKFMDYLDEVAVPLWLQYSPSKGIGQPKHVTNNEQRPSESSSSLIC